MPSWFDIGINLPDKRLPFDQIGPNAIENDVTGMLLIGSHVEQSKQALELTSSGLATLVASAGVHPHNAKDVADGYLLQLEQLAKHAKVVAIGECGLDFNRNFSPANVQLRVFEEQLELATQVNLPVYLHERDAFEQQISLLKKYQSRLTGGVVHCFTGTREQANAYLELGFYIGVTGWVCDPKRGDQLRDALADIPLDKLLLETDSPYLFPKTLKSKSRNNQPANLPHIAKTVADIKDVELQYLKQSCWRNTIRFFDLDLSSEV